MKILTAGIIVIIILSFATFLQIYKEDNQMESEVYLGPVPEGYDLEHFRKTGITRPLEDGE